MGRPSLTSALPQQRRSHRLSDEDAADSHESGSNTAFPRRFPKLGSAFQIRSLPECLTTASEYSSSRSEPIPMSGDVPYCTVEQVESLDRHKEAIVMEDDSSTNRVALRGSTELPWSSSGSFNWSTVLPGYGASQTVCNPEYKNLNIRDSETSQPQPDVHNNNEEDDNILVTQWMHSVLQWQAIQLGTASITGRRRQIKKRPRSPPDSSPTGSTTSDKNKKPRPGVLLDVPLPPPAVIAPNAVSTWVAWGGGRTQAARRAAARQAHRNRFKQPPPSSSASWWGAATSQSIPVWGDFRNSSSPYIDPSATAASVVVTDDPVNVWKAVLAYVQAVQGQLSSLSSSATTVAMDESNNNTDESSDGSTIIYLSQLVRLVDYARRLPCPDDIFRGSQASLMVEAIALAFHDLRQIIQKARHHQSKIMDQWSHFDGLQVDTLKQAVDDAAKALAPLRLDETDEWLRQIQVVSDWQDAVAQAMQLQDEQQLSVLKELAHKASSLHCFVASSLVELQAKLHKVAQLQDTIRDWIESGRTETPKWIASTLRDVQRLQIQFTERTTLERIYEQTCQWVERANIAIRSRLSFGELQLLVATQQELVHTNVGEFHDKLQSRLKAAHEWVEQVAVAVPGAPVNCCAQWMQAVRDRLDQGHGAELHDLACQGGRLPVQVPAVQLLQVELEARAWTHKTFKWIPSGADDDCSSTSSGTSASTEQQQQSTKRGNMSELKEHLEKARLLRERVVLDNDQDRQTWVLPGEDALRQLVESAEEWLRKYDEVKDKNLSMDVLRQIDQEGQDINVNLSPATTNVSKALAQAEEWYQKYSYLVLRCRDSSSPGPLVQVSELQAAVDAGDADLPIDLDEVLELQRVLKLIERWQNTVAMATGTKPRRGKKMVVTVEDLERLVEEASVLPVDTKQDVMNLQSLVQSVEEWQTIAAARLDEIRVGLEELRRAMEETYGAPAYYVRKRWNSSESVEESNDDEMDVDDDLSVETETAAEESIKDQTTGARPADTIGNDASPTSRLSNSASSVQAMIESFFEEAGEMLISTPELELAETLVAIARWCSRSLKYLDTQRDIFDKRFFGAFDRFFSEGKSLGSGANATSCSAQAGEVDNLQRLQATWTAVVGDQLQRLSTILSDREDYIKWCKTTEALIFADDKKPTLERLRELTTKSHAFPGTSDLVKRVRQLAKDAALWVERANDAMSMEKKMTLSEAKALCDEGDKLGFQCSELRRLRSGIKAARGWANRVRRIKVDQGTTHVEDVQTLVDEHDDLLVLMPEEIAKLSRATKNYCICRRPYEGFMVGCDGCGDWFHGACIGVSESKADKVDNYVCIRCCISRTFKSSAAIVVGIIKKWTSEKDMKRARQVVAQRHQRKVRKEAQAIEKLRKEEAALKQKLEGQALSDVSSKGEADTLALPGGKDPSQTVTGSCVIVTTISPHEAVPSDEVPGPRLVSQDSEELSKSQSDVPMPVPGTLPENQDTVSDMDVEETPKPAAETDKESSPEAIMSRLDEIAKSIHVSESRLDKLAKQLITQKKDLELEDESAPLLREWCIRVRSLVLVPISMERAKTSQPKADGSLSSAMLSVIEEAEKFNVKRFEDVMSVINAFACMGWTMRATTIFARQPSMADVESLVEQTSRLDLPDEKAFRMMKTMLQRAGAWQNKVAKALAPLPGDSQPFDLDTLRDLSHAGSDCPLYMPFESRLLTVIEDKGMRHCVCGGPSDGRFMLSCDKCEMWFHGHCVGIRSTGSPEVWICPACSGCPVVAEKLDLSDFHEKFDADTESEGSPDEEDDDVSSKAPKPDLMWPPYGLLKSAKATEALGDVCCAIPDSTDEWKVEEVSRNPPPESTSTNPPPASTAKCGDVSITSQIQNAVPLVVAVASDNLAKSDIPDKQAPAEIVCACHEPTSSDSSSSLIQCSSEGSSPATDLTLATCTKSEEGSMVSISLSNLISETSSLVETETTTIGRRQECGSVTQLIPCDKASFRGSAVPVTGSVTRKVNTTNRASRRPQSVSQGPVSIEVADNARDAVDLGSNVQREILVAPIQNSLCD